VAQKARILAKTALLWQCIVLWQRIIWTKILIGVILYGMNMKRLCWLCLGALAAAEPLAAQIAGRGEAVFAPFVSRLQGEVKNNLVRLSWMDSSDVRGPVYIYRSSTPFEESGGHFGSLPAEIPYGTGAYIDEVEGFGTFYYFAAASDERGKRYDIPLSSINSVVVEVRSGGAPQAGAGGNTASGGTVVPEAAGGISALEAAAQGDGVALTFWAGDVKSAVLYRSVQPLRQTSDLLGALIVQSGIRSPFTDYPVRGVPYYYAVVSEDDLIRGTVEIFPGRNATQMPVEAGSGAALASADREIRPLPLPQVSLEGALPNMNAYAETPKRLDLSPQAAKVLDTPARSSLPLVQKKPRAFARDLEVIPAGGEEYALSALVRGPFLAKRWDTARDELVKFLALPRSPAVEGRARFYLGQCHYFLGQSREGLFEFLAIQDRYPDEAAEWIQAALDKLRR
jgi:hypothetical protein